MTKDQQVVAWMSERPVIREWVNGQTIEHSGDAARAIYEAAYDSEITGRPVYETERSRAAGRASLRTAWDGLPSWIRGPYRDKFEVANRLLDEGDDEAARDLIKYATPLPDSEETPLAAFEAARAQMMSGIDALPK